MRAALAALLILVLGLTAFFYGRSYIEAHPQDVPWTQLSLTDPVGRFTGRKLAALSDDASLCRGLLQRAGSNAAAVPPRRQGEQCGYDNGFRLKGQDLSFAPAGPVTACPVAAAMVLFERQVLQPAARRHFGKEVSAINHAGSYSCRRLYGRSQGAYSEHATANALDITGFTLAGGEKISVLRDWQDRGGKGAFLREIRDGACGLFATVLSPDYNEAHADHLHLDQALRGRSGWRMCR
jgi:hypothetical protein